MPTPRRPARSENLAGVDALRFEMKIRSHSESHIVELEDGSRWQVFPGDLDVTLGWKPETDLTLLKVDGEIGSYVLLSNSGPVRVNPVGEGWAISSINSTP